MADKASKPTDNLVVAIALCALAMALSLSLLSGTVQIVAMAVCFVGIVVCLALFGARLRSRKR